MNGVKGWIVAVMTPGGGNDVKAAPMTPPLAEKAVGASVMAPDPNTVGVNDMPPALVITGVNPRALAGPMIVIVRPDAVAL
jgi:hypothetical protein